MSANPRKILVVEDEMILAMNIKLFLEEAGYSVQIAIEGEEALAVVEKDTPDIIFMDITLGGKMDGIEAAKKIMESSNVPVIYLTGNSDTGTIENAKQTNPAGFLQKPVEDYEMLEILENI